MRLLAAKNDLGDKFWLTNSAPRTTFAMTVQVITKRVKNCLLMASGVQQLSNEEISRYGRQLILPEWGIQGIYCT